MTKKELEHAMLVKECAHAALDGILAGDCKAVAIAATEDALAELEELFKEHLKGQE